MTIDEKVLCLEGFCTKQLGCGECPIDAISAKYGNSCRFDKDGFVNEAYFAAFGSNGERKLVDMSKAHAQIMDSFITAFETVLEQIEGQCAVDAEEPEQAHDGNDVVSNWKVYGLEDSIKRSKYPKAVDISKCTAEITPGVEALGNCQTGTGHDQFLTGIIVQFDLTFTVKAWTEAERYHFLDFVSSQSTMHRIAQFNIREQCIEYVCPEIIEIVEGLVMIYNEDPTPENYLKLLYNVPVGFRLTAGMTTNYRQLKTIYQQRKTHRLPEWRSFCEWIEQLPMFKELCLSGNKNF